MKKEVNYYLEDISRLNEISQSELDAWITEMPFHQPLQLLAGLKSEMDGHVSDENLKVHAAYFAEDFELNTKSKVKKTKQQAKSTKQVAAILNLPTESKALEVEKERKEKVVTKSTPLVEAEHSVDSENIEVGGEDAPDSMEGKLKRIVSSDLADELLEEEVILEVLEEKLDIEILDSNDLDQDAVTGEADIDATEILDADEDEPDLSKVDYSNYTNIVADIEDEKEEDLEITTENVILDSNLVKLKKDKSEKKKKKKKKEKQTKKEKKGKEKKGKKSGRKKKKPSKKSKEKEQNKKTFKGKIKNKIKENPKVSKKSKGKKGKKKKQAKNVEYIIVESSSQKKNFKLKDYDGVSNYTSWLLEQESINDRDDSIKEVKPVMNKAKKKKKKKKSKKLKIAVDSIKKQDSIISEPLARILALQGHKKKAKKMYAKLAKVFPEKESYFREMVEALEKGEK